MEKRVLISRWLGGRDRQAVPIYDEASVSSARQRVRETGRRWQLSNAVIETAAIIASELAHNHLKHAKQGYIDVTAIQRGAIRGLEVTAADMGPGIPNPAQILAEQTDPHAHSLGAGVAAVRRLADEVDFDNRIEEGLRITARKFEAQTGSGSYEAAIMGRPYPGEAISGDDAVFLPTDSGFVAAIADGLGHGPEAREASNRAIEQLSVRLDMDLAQLALAVNEALYGTRGCALSIVRFSADDRTLECVSAGEVYSHIYRYKEAHFFASSPLVIGAGPLNRKKIRIETAAAEPGSVLVMFTDGLKSKTNLKAQLDLLRQPAIIMAERLIERDSRPDDDALVLVARLPSAFPPSGKTQ